MSTRQKIEDVPWSELFKLFFVLYWAINIGVSAFTGFGQSLHIFEQIRPLQAIEDAGAIAVCIPIAFVLYDHVPWCRWWIGTPIIMLLNRRKPHAEQRPVDNSPGNVNLWAFNLRLIGPVYAVLLFFVIPQIANFEENTFRLGTSSWGEAVFRSVLFAAVHLLVCVPFGFMVSIFMAGLWLSFWYFHGGVAVSTVHHTTYDCELLLIALLWFLCHKLKERYKRTGAGEVSDEQELQPD